MIPAYRDPKWLRQAYLVEKRTMEDIANEFDVGISTIQKYVERFGIPTRKRGEQRKDGRTEDATCITCRRPFKARPDQDPRWSRCPECKELVSEFSGALAWITKCFRY